MGLSLEQLARAVGEPVERLREWREAGVLGRGRLTPADVERGRLVALLRRRGVTLDEIARQRADIDGFVSRVGRAPTAVVRTLAEAAAEVGLDAGLAERAWTAAGLPATDLLDESDVDFLRAWRTVHDVGQPDEAMVELARVLGDTVRRATEAMARITHFRIIKPLVARGLEPAALRQAIGRATGRLLPIAPRMLEHLTRRLLAEASRENFALRLVDDRTEPGELMVAIVFVDLCGFTPMAEAMGDRKSADVLARFSALVRVTTGGHDGHVFKQIGDGFMLIFVDPRDAVACALEIDARVATEPRFPAVRAGINWGPVLYRDGDYVGANVNVAARVAAEAGRHEVFVTGAVRAAAAAEGVEFAPLGRRRLKGIGEEVELFRVGGAGTAGVARSVDPVCGMEMRPHEAGVRLTLGAREVVFCSAACLQRYVADPARYTPATGG